MNTAPRPLNAVGASVQRIGEHELKQPFTTIVLPVPAFREALKRTLAGKHAASMLGQKTYLFRAGRV